ncbi:MAG: twin-arginine translocase subunit TatC [Solirubrobacterales bacterium]|nr:twin-arginine translocase subunit TatC [Solirubrobacterales bacterium]
MARVGPVDFEDRLTLVEHLDELRSRIIISLAAFGVAFALCLWQNHLLLDIANGPLPNDRDKLLTFGVAEPFTTTLLVSAYGAIIIALPVLLYQVYAYILPALSHSEKKVALPLMLLAPFLFVAGVAFAYFIVLPSATKFLLNFNEDQFNIEVRAKDYYGFMGMTLLSCGVLFQVPIAILAVTRAGIVTTDQLAANRRYAILVIAVVAMLLPGTDPVTMLISMIPLVFLFEGSLILSRVFARPDRTAAEETDPDPDDLGITGTRSS